ncbi:MAG: hypothetical protein SFW09_03200 [Hyphomicrobiaceae bacterium]|nr:hypothetical protein [Hyphomicrobiaceae bacterium]
MADALKTSSGGAPVAGKPADGAASPADGTMTGLQINAYVFTTGSTAPSARQAIERAREMWRDMPALQAIEKGEGASLLVADGTQGVVGMTRLVATQFPVALLRKAASHAVAWPTVASDLAGHTAHVVVSVVHADPMFAHMLLSHLTAAVLEQTRGCGVYWVNTGALIPASGFIAQCNKTADGHVPAMLWTKVGFARGKSDDGQPRMLAYTTGLPSFGLLDFECICSADQLRSPVLGFMYGVACGSITRGEQPTDGTGTKVEAPGVKMVSFHRSPSRRRPNAKAIRLVIHA